ncbi:XdhC family protein [Novispirillum itersonii]|uniref:Xanthine dehydrogenase accessory factor n=1 Tax=Novispirillum itersonii TaxID=189 RepID=A0A7X0DNP2_NOVIT|nr:XdhC family protein [Novispirillum itersonii]MBB6212190.1 xanthine dehydrogenase accessory factor [Novispirillum itersonii]
MKTDLLTILLDLKARRIPAALVTDMADGTQGLVTTDGCQGDLALTAEETAAVLHRLDQDDSGPLPEEPGTEPGPEPRIRPLFVDTHAPPLRLAVVGAVHVAQHLVPMAAAAGFDLLVIDPRGSFASEDRFPGVRLSQDWPDEALTGWGVDRRTAVVTLTHDPKFDDPALTVALRSDAFYIGALGSRRTHASRCERLTEAGFTAADLARIHAPIGLPIGAKSPMEIALSILSQIVAVRRKAPAATGATR